MTNMFYRAFEERCRGSRELIKTRLEVYLPFIEPLKTVHEHPQALDLGCGRGEWLELLQEHGFSATGVDLDEGMLLACRELNLNVIKHDAIDYIKNLPSESQSIVSAFHFVEHIPFELLQQLVVEAYRVLKPGGLLILETPNSENLLVGTSSFYLDPTHHQPVPASLLSFVAEYVKFQRVKTIYLQEKNNFSADQLIQLSDILDGVSPDYAVVAQKAGVPKTLVLFDPAFNREYGTRLLKLAERYDQQTAIQTNWFQTELHKLKKIIVDLDIINERNTQLQNQVHKLQEELDQIETKYARDPQSLAHYWWKVANELNQQLNEIYNSSSWRITKSLVFFKKILQKISTKTKKIGKKLRATIKIIVITITKKIARKILSYPKLRKTIYYHLSRFPFIKHHLRHFIIRFDLAKDLFSSSDAAAQQLLFTTYKVGNNLSPRAVRISMILQRIIKDKEKT